MLPILLHIGSFKIYTFGVFLLLAFFWSCYLIWRNIRISKFSEESAFDVILLSFVFSLFIGRILHVVLHFSDFGFDILKILLVNGYPGVSVVGMIAGFIGSLHLITQSKKIKANEFLDYIVPSLFLFSAIVELGAFFSGSEPGKRWGWFIHPVSLYGAIILFAGAYLAQRMLYLVRKDKMMKGFSFVFFLWLFSLTYIIRHLLKDRRALWTDNRIEYWIFVSLLLTLGIYIVYYFKDFIGQSVKTFISLRIHHVEKTIKTVPQKSEKHH